MTELIPIRPNVISDEQVKTVDARGLHAFLEVGRDFSMEKQYFLQLILLSDTT